MHKIEINPGGGTIVPGNLPPRVCRRAAAQIVTRNFFPVSHRTLERWPLTWRRVNGRALVETADLLKEAQRRLDEATAIIGGHR
jgi:hypothetical protein